MHQETFRRYCKLHRLSEVVSVGPEIIHIVATRKIMNIFGQNKTGMRTFDSVAGNTWRGFSASAESAGEFYGFVLLMYFLCSFYTFS